MKTLPIDEILPDLKKALQTHHTAVIHAPPGAGKTTRVPLMLLDAVVPSNGKIIMLEPRRLAAVSAARWMAGLLGEKIGATVGYSIRFESRLSQKTRIEVMTEGILTRRIQNDPGLEGVSLVIFDEFHERSIQADLALALCLHIRKNLREDLRILVMSATLDSHPVASLLGNAPVISSPGKQYSVEERYIESNQNRPLKARVLDAVRTALYETEGDILVFLPGAGEIRACSEELRSLRLQKTFSLHPLYADLAFEEQERAILPSAERKIVLATNIAETSITIEGVRAVIDTGLARSLRYDPESGINRLVTVTVSRASAEQRKGRAGRLAPGVCYRLYSRSAFRSMAEFTPPAMRVSDISSLILDLALWGVKDPSELMWLDPPGTSASASAKCLLMDLGAIDTNEAITAGGRAIARLPVHPRLGHLMVRAAELGVPRLGADLAAILSERDFLKAGQSGFGKRREADVSLRLDILGQWRTTGAVPEGADLWAIRNADRTARELLNLIGRGKGESSGAYDYPIGRLLLSAFPDRIARSRDGLDGRFVLSGGRGVRISSESEPGRSRFIVAVNVDGGEGREGVVHMAAAISEEMIRQECSRQIETLRRVEWDEREGRIAAVMEERMGAVVLSSKNFSPSEEEVIPILCSVVKSSPQVLPFGPQEQQLRYRVMLLDRAFPGEGWPDFSNERLAGNPEGWLAPFLSGIRTVRGLSGLDVMSALRALLSWEQLRLLDEYAPLSLVVPSGRRAALRYSAEAAPVLAVKLQEMFGLSETPSVARGRVKVLLHLLSPAGRPVQITQDLKAFWNFGYPQVRKELRGRYPKHPWPEDPWSALPTKGTKKKTG